MITLEDFVNSLSKYNQFSLNIELLKMSLPIWGNFADKNKKNLSYNDTVVGMLHTINKNLLYETIDIIDSLFKIHGDNFVQLKDKRLISLFNEFCEPIVALHELDWKIPYEVERIFYAVYNLLKASIAEEITAFGETFMYLITNQAIDSLVSSNYKTYDQLKPIVYKYI